MTMRECKWPDCKKAVSDMAPAGLCGTHQNAVRVVYQEIRDLGYGKAVASKWACKLTPHITERVSSQTEYFIMDTVPTKLVRQSLERFGACERTAYQRVAAMPRSEDGEVMTNDYIREVISAGEWTDIPTAVSQLGASHRQLRHLVYERKVPEVLALCRRRNGDRFHYGFYKTELTELRAVIDRIPLRRAL